MTGTTSKSTKFAPTIIQFNVVELQQADGVKHHSYMGLGDDSQLYLYSVKISGWILYSDFIKEVEEKRA